MKPGDKTEPSGGGGDKPAVPKRLDLERTVPELNLAPAEPLTPYDEEFYIPHVADGQDVRVGTAFTVTGEIFYLHCDFVAFASKLKDVTPQKLDEMFVADGKLESQFPDLDEDARRLLYTCWRTARIVRNLLGDVTSDDARYMSFDAYKQESNTGIKECIKPLSECRGTAVCSEYALLAHAVLRKLGLASAVVVGAYESSADGVLTGRHTYLVLQDGAVMFDPTHTAQQPDSWPPKVFIPSEPLTVQTLRNMSTGDDEPFGHKIQCTDIVTKQVAQYGSGASY